MILICILPLYFPNKAWSFTFLSRLWEYHFYYIPASKKCFFSLFFFNQSGEFKVTSHCCFNLQIPSKYGLLFTGFLAVCICSLGIACLYCLSILPESCLSCQFTRVIDSNPLPVIHSPPQLSSLQVLSCLRSSSSFQDHTSRLSYFLVNLNCLFTFKVLKIP